jgi:uncharacterized protein
MIRNNKILPSIPSNFALSKRSFIIIPPVSITHEELAGAYHLLNKSGDEEITGPGTKVSTTRVLLLVDRSGSMIPFQRMNEEFCKAIQQLGKQEQVTIYYFHNVPSEDYDEIKLMLASSANQPLPSLDTLLTKIEPLTEGYLYSDQDLLSPEPLSIVLQEHAVGSTILLVSDAGAGSSRYNVLRLFTSVAFLKAISSYTLHYVWLNPLSEDYWHNRNNTAAYIAHYVPMFSLNRDGIYQAFNALLGQSKKREEKLL